MEEIDTSRPHEARVYDYILGGKDNYAADREVGEQLLRALPWMTESARHNRAFLRRAVQFVVGGGVDQFLDIGTGLPTVENTHTVAQAANPEARVVETDYDALVAAAETSRDRLLEAVGTTSAAVRTGTNLTPPATWEGQ